MRLTTNGELTIEFQGGERFSAFVRQVVLPRDEILAARYHESYEDPGGAWRMAGTGMPRVLYAGRFRRRGKTEFWYLRRPTGVRRVRASDVLELETSGRFSRVLLSVERDEAERIIAWLEHR